MIVCGSWNCLCLYLQSFKIFNILRWTIYDFHHNCHRCLNIKNHISECNKIFITCIMNGFCVPPVAKLVERLSHSREVNFISFAALRWHCISHEWKNFEILHIVWKIDCVSFAYSFLWLLFSFELKACKKKFWSSWSRHLLLMVCPFVNLSHF